MTQAQIIPFVFQDKPVRSIEIDGEPWFVGRDVCAILNIKKAEQGLGRLEDDERGTYSIGTPGGVQKMIVVSEPGVYRLIFTSTKAEAEEFKRWLAHEVIPTLRKTGKFAAEQTPEPYSFAGDRALAQLNCQLAVVKEARLLFGPARAAALWTVMGLPDASVSSAPNVHSGSKCLAHLLDATDNRGIPFGELLEHAFAADQSDSELDLAFLGLRVQWDEPQGVLVANGHPGLMKTFAGTPWANGRWSHALKRLPGAHIVGPTRFASDTHRGVFIPADLVLDAILAS